MCTSTKAINHRKWFMSERTKERIAAFVIGFLVVWVVASILDMCNHTCSLAAGPNTTSLNLFVIIMNLAKLA